MKNLKLSDNLLARIVQILQEGLITGTDITDHMRMIRVDVCEGELQLSKEYLEQVQRGFESINAEAKALASKEMSE